MIQYNIFVLLRPFGVDGASPVSDGCGVLSRSGRGCAQQARILGDQGGEL